MAAPWRTHSDHVPSCLWEVITPRLCTAARSLLWRGANLHGSFPPSRGVRGRCMLGSHTPAPRADKLRGGCGNIVRSASGNPIRVCGCEQTFSRQWASSPRACATLSLTHAGVWSLSGQGLIPGTCGDDAVFAGPKRPNHHECPGRPNASPSQNDPPVAWPGHCEAHSPQHLSAGAERWPRSQTS